MADKMKLSLGQKLGKDTDKEEVETEAPVELDPFFEEQ